MKKILSGFLIPVLIISLFTGTVFAENSSFEYTELPTVKLTGSLDGISKENKVTVDVEYSSAEQTFTSKATLKVQGATSAKYPKKNFSMQLLKDDGSKNKVTLVDSWGKESKYCLKANYIDRSQARNIVSARIYGQIVRSRFHGDELEGLVNGGGIDGYPVAVYLNGEFYGLYTMNIPKDNWLFGMKDESLRQALLFSSGLTGAVALREELAENVEDSGFDMEYCSTEDDTEIGTGWARDSFNEFIRFLNNNDGEDFRAGIGKYTDVERAIDSLIYTFYLHANDNTAKNIIWTTYDGVKWVPSLYDLDDTWGLKWNGTFVYVPDDFPFAGDNLLYERLLKNYPDEIRARYVELREDILSRANVEKMFSAFLSRIPQEYYDLDDAKWEDMPGKGVDTLEQVLDFITKRAEYLDKYLGVTVTEKTADAYKAEFSVPRGTKILVYPSQDYTAEPVRALSAFSADADTGELTKTDGQINFRVVPPEGSEIESVTVTPTENYKNLKGPGDTELENTYRVTKLTGDVAVSVTLREEDEEPIGYPVSFNCDEGARILVYPMQNYELEAQETEKTVSVDADTGIPTVSGEGQVNFTVLPPEGYEVGEIAVSPAGAYKNLKGPEDTEKENTYRITKITGELSVFVTLTKTETEETTVGDPAGYEETTVPEETTETEQTTEPEETTVPETVTHHEPLPPIIVRPERYPMGDVNGDGKLDAEDARLALRAAVGLEKYAKDSPEFIAADVNETGNILPDDARMILRVAVGLARFYTD